MQTQPSGRHRLQAVEPARLPLTLRFTLLLVFGSLVVLLLVQFKPQGQVETGQRVVPAQPAQAQSLERWTETMGDVQRDCSADAGCGHWTPVSE